MQYEFDLVFPEPMHFAYILSNAFFKTDEWKRLRYAAIQQYGGKCQCCGQRPEPGNPIQVDHIKPRSLYPWLALDPDNLQVLCRDCNLGKSNVDYTDWREYDAVM